MTDAHDPSGGADDALAPLVVTLELDPVTQARFDRERTELFPPGRTQVGAHVTLFHAVPGRWRSRWVADLRAAGARPVFPVRVAALMPLGRGVAYAIAAEELDELHRGLQRQWWDDLTAQDRQGFRAHVTVQNKVDPAVARATRQALAQDFVPFETTATGLRLWRYDGGPWTAVARFPFAAPLDPPR